MIEIALGLFLVVAVFAMGSLILASTWEFRHMAESWLQWTMVVASGGVGVSVLVLGLALMIEMM